MSQVRFAQPADVPGITALVQGYARHGALLPRSADAITQSLPDWVVVADGTRIFACGSLLPYSSTLAEVRSLAVAPGAQGHGFGRAIVEALITLGRARQVDTLFALTRAVPFFLRLGFKISDKEHFPQKVWQDCHVCPLRDNCDETAVELILSAVGAHSMPSN